MVLCCLCLTDKTRNPPSSQHTSEIDNKKETTLGMIVKQFLGLNRPTRF